MTAAPTCSVPGVTPTEPGEAAEAWVDAWRRGWAARDADIAARTRRPVSSGRIPSASLWGAFIRFTPCEQGIRTCLEKHGSAPSES